MNLFETLGAPTSSTTRTLTLIANAKLDRADECEKARVLLLNPEDRIRAELTTVRMEEEWEGAELGYGLFCEDLAGTVLDGIPLSYAGGWFRTLLSAAGKTAYQKGESALSIALRVLPTDPWLTQGVAALLLRLSESAERRQPAAVSGLLDKAFKLYQAFFGKTNCLASHAYALFTSPTQRGQCQKAWDEFVPWLAQTVVDRAKDAIAQGRDKAVAPLVDALLSEGLQQTGAVGSESWCPVLLESYRTAFHGMIKLADIAALVATVPPALTQQDKEQRLLCATLDAITEDIKRLAKNGGSLRDIHTLSLRVKAETLEKHKNLLVVASANALYDAATDRIRVLINHGDSRGREGADHPDIQLLLDLLPMDVLIAEADGENITRQNFSKLTIAKTLKQTIKAAKANNAAKTLALGRTVWQMVSQAEQNPVRRGQLATAAISMYIDDQDNDYLPEYIQSFDSDVAITAGDYKTVGELREFLKRKVGPGRMIKEIETAQCMTSSDVSTLGRRVWNMIESLSAANVEERIALATNAIGCYMNLHQHEYLLEFLTAFDANQHIKSDDFATVKDLKDHVRQSAVFDQIINLVKDGRDGSYQQARMLGGDAQSFISSIRELAIRLKAISLAVNVYYSEKDRDYITGFLGAFDKDELQLALSMSHKGDDNAGKKEKKPGFFKRLFGRGD